MTTYGTTPTIRDLFDPGELDAAIADGYVRRQVHPTEPLAILKRYDRPSTRRKRRDARPTEAGPWSHRGGTSVPPFPS